MAFKLTLKGKEKMIRGVRETVLQAEARARAQGGKGKSWEDRPSTTFILCFWTHRESSIHRCSVGKKNWLEMVLCTEKEKNESLMSEGLTEWEFPLWLSGNEPIWYP